MDKKINHTDIIDKTKLANFIIKWNANKKEGEHILKYFYSNYDLLLDEDNLYTNPQKAGSCSWFSLFWCLVFYYLINNNADDSIEFINKTTQQFHKKILELYSDKKILLLINEKKK